MSHLIKEWRSDERSLAQKVKDQQDKPFKSIQYITFTVTIAAALIYLNSSATDELFGRLADNTIPVLTAALTLILGIMVVRLAISSLSGFISTVGLKRYAKDLGFSGSTVEGFFKALEAFLYLIILEITATQLGMSSQIISTILTAAAYSIIGVLALLAFFGFKDLVQNYAAGMYIRASDVLKPGKKVKIDEERGEIRDVSAFGTTITTDSGYFMLTPNKQLMDKEILFKRVKADVDTLEDIKNYFVAQTPSYCGPASAEMALAMFGFDVNQGELGEIAGTTVGEGTEPDELITAVEQATSGEVRGAFIEYDKITDLSDEFKTWFNDGALIIPNFAKPVLFPSSDTGHYTLSAAVEDDELLIIDPSSHTVSGGVYYVDKKEMLEAMAEWRGETRGYIVLAPKGSTAYWRIKHSLLYAKMSYYDEISKTLEVKLKKTMRKGRILERAMPDSVEDFLEGWRKESHVKRLWKPEDESGGPKKLDEFTDTDK